MATTYFQDVSCRAMVWSVSEVELIDGAIRDVELSSSKSEDKDGYSYYCL